MERITLWCTIEGDANLFFVEITPTSTVAHLKKLIQERKNAMLGSVDATDLVLYKVRCPRGMALTKLNICFDSSMSRYLSSQPKLSLTA